MSTLVREPSLSTVDSLDDIDAIVCFVPDDQTPFLAGTGYVDFRLCGALSRAIDGGFFSGAPGEKLLMPSEGRLPSPLVFAVGLGASRAVTVLGFEHALATAYGMLERVKAEDVVLAVPPLPQLDTIAIGGVLTRSFVTKWKAGRVIVLGDPGLARTVSRETPVLR